MPTNFKVPDPELGDVPFSSMRTFDPNRDIRSQLTPEERMEIENALQQMKLLGRGTPVVGQPDPFNIPRVLETMLPPGHPSMSAAPARSPLAPGELEQRIATPPLSPNLRRSLSAGAAATAVGLTGGGIAPMMLAAGGGALGSGLAMREETGEDLSQVIRQARNEMLFEGAASGGIGMVRSMLFRSLGKRIPEDARLVAAAAEDMGIPLGVENVIDPRTAVGRVTRGTRNIFGRMPFFSKPFKQQDVRQIESLVAQRENLLGTIAPVVHTVTETGADLSEEALRRSKAIGSAFSQQYDRLLDAAETQGVRIPTDALRRAARGIVDETGNLPRRVVPGSSPPSREPIEMPGREAFDPSIIDWARSNLLDIETETTARRFKSLVKGLNGVIQKAAAEGATDRMRHATILRRAMEEDFAAMTGPDALIRQMRGLDASFRQWAELMEGPTARRIASSTPGFGTRFLGDRAHTAQADLLFERVFQMQSPQAMDELARLVGPRRFRDALSTYVNDATFRAFREAPSGEAGQAIKRGFIDFDSIGRDLGIGRPRSPERAAFERALQRSGAKSTVRDWERYFEVAQSVLSQSDVNVPQLLARRLALGGPGSVVRAFTSPVSMFRASSRMPGGRATQAAAGTGGILSFMIDPVLSAAGAGMALTAAIGSRRWMRILLTEPETMRQATRLMDPRVAPRVRTQIAHRLARSVGRETWAEMEQQLDQALGILRDEASERRRRAERAGARVSGFIEGRDDALNERLDRIEDELLRQGGSR